MSIGERWRLRWRNSAKEWLQGHRQRLPATRWRTVRRTLDRRLQQIAQFPYSGIRCNAHDPELSDLADAYRIAMVEDLVLIYFVAEAERMIVIVHLQTTAMDTPSLETLAR